MRRSSVFAISAIIAGLCATPALAAPAPILVPAPRAHIESLSATADGTIYASSTAGIVFRAAPGAAGSGSLTERNEALVRLIAKPSRSSQAIT